MTGRRRFGMWVTVLAAVAAFVVRVDHPATLTPVLVPSYSQMGGAAPVGAP